MFRIEPLTDEHRQAVNDLVEDSWGSCDIVSRGKVHDARLMPGFVALIEDDVAGYLMYDIQGDACEITVLESLEEGQGIGSALLNEVKVMAMDQGLRRLWLITTNDNTHALRFYQRCGYTLCAMHVNAIEQARKLKPKIPLLGFAGIPIQHEMELEKTFTYR